MEQFERTIGMWHAFDVWQSSPQSRLPVVYGPAAALYHHTHGVVPAVNTGDHTDIKGTVQGCAHQGCTALCAYRPDFLAQPCVDSRRADAVEALPTGSAVFHRDGWIKRAQLSAPAQRRGWHRPPLEISLSQVDGVLVAIEIGKGHSGHTKGIGDRTAVIEHQGTAVQALVRLVIAQQTQSALRERVQR